MRLSPSSQPKEKRSSSFPRNCRSSLASATGSTPWPPGTSLVSYPSRKPHRKALCTTCPKKRNRTMSALRESLGFLASRLRQVGIFVALILIVLLFQILTDGILLQPQNVTNLVVQNSYILILAIGMVMVIIA